MALKDKVVVDIQTNTKTAHANVLKYAAGIGTAVAAVAGLTKSIGDMISAYSKQEDAERKLRAALKATGGQAGMTESELKKLASQLQKTTTFGDEATIAAESLMLTFTKIGRDTFPSAIKAAQDMSTMFGQDLQSSVVQLGTALNDPIQGIGRLRRIGISFTKEQQDSIRAFVEQNDIISAQKIILQELHNEFGGVSEAMADTTSGSLKQLKNAMGDLNEIGGEAIASFLQPAVRWLADMATKAADTAKHMREIDEILQDSAKHELTPIEETQRRLKIITDEISKYQDAIEKKAYGQLGSRAVLESKIKELKVEQLRLAGRLNDQEAEMATKQEQMLRARAEMGDMSEEEIKDQAQILSNYNEMMELYYKTTKGRLDLLRKEEAKWEDRLERWKYNKDIVAEILNMLYDQDAELESQLRTQLQTNKTIEETASLVYTEGMHIARIKADEEDRIFLENEIMQGINKQTDEYEKQKDVIKEVAKEQNKMLNKASELSSMFFGTVNDYWDLYKEKLDESYQRQLDYINEIYDTEEDRAGAKMQLDEQMAEKEHQLKVRQAQWNKAAAIMDATIKGAVAVVQALTLPPPFGEIMAGVVAAITAAQIGIIAAQPIPMAEGGIVTGPTNILAGEAGPEAIIPLDRGANLGTTIIHVHGSLISERELQSYIWRTVEAKASGY